MVTELFAKKPIVFLQIADKDELVYIEVEDIFGQVQFAYIIEQSLYEFFDEPTNPTLKHVSTWGGIVRHSSGDWRCHFAYRTGGDEEYKSFDSHEDAIDLLKRHVRWHYEYHRDKGPKYDSREQKYCQVSKSALLEGDTPLTLADFRMDKVVTAAFPTNEKELSLAAELLVDPLNSIELVIYRKYTDPLHTNVKYICLGTIANHEVVQSHSKVDPRPELYEVGFSFDYGYWQAKKSRL